MGFDIIGGVVLVDPDGNPYASGAPVSGTFAPQAWGSVVLIDPETGEPYKIGA